jgi:dimethylamine corrinoid protein
LNIHRNNRKYPDGVTMINDFAHDLAQAIVSMDDKAASDLCRKAAESGMPPAEILTDGLIKGMEEVGKKYEIGDYSVADLLLCSDALYAGLSVLQPYLVKGRVHKAGHVVLGVIQGDIHDIGKNLVKVMLEGSNYKVTDLGQDVPYADFVNAAVEANADIIGLSSLLSTAIPGMAEVIAILNQRGLRQRFKVIIGGASVTPAYALKIGADGYAETAPSAVKLVQSLLKDRKY